MTTPGTTPRALTSRSLRPSRFGHLRLPPARSLPRRSRAPAAFPPAALFTRRSAVVRSVISTFTRRPRSAPADGGKSSAARRRCRRRDRHAQVESSMAMTRSFNGVTTGAPCASKKRRQMSPTAPRAQRLQLPGGENVAARGQHLRRRDRADADQRHRDRLEQRRRLLNVAVLQHHPPRLGRAHGAGRRKQRRAAAEQVGQPPRQLRRVQLRRWGCRCRQGSARRAHRPRAGSGAWPRPSPGARRSTTRCRRRRVAFSVVSR